MKVVPSGLLWSTTIPRKLEERQDWCFACFVKVANEYQENQKLGAQEFCSSYRHNTGGHSCKSWQHGENIRMDTIQEATITRDEHTEIKFHVLISQQVKMKEVKRALHGESGFWRKRILFASYNINIIAIPKWDAKRKMCMLDIFLFLRGGSRVEGNV